MAHMKKCPKCPAKFRKRSVWLRHMRSKHDTDNTWKM